MQPFITARPSAQNQASATSESLKVEEPSLATVTVHTGSVRSGSP